MNTSRKKVAIGVAAGVLALAGVATLLKRRKDKNFRLVSLFYEFYSNFIIFHDHFK